MEPKSKNRAVELYYAVKNLETDVQRLREKIDRHKETLRKICPHPYGYRNGNKCSLCEMWVTASYDDTH